MNHRYFTISELCFSRIALNERIKNVASKDVEDCLDTLIVKVLDPLRAAMGRPITVSSGYRCKELNDHKDIRGSRTSGHLKGHAADITLGSSEANRMMAQWIAKHLTFDQLIDESSYKWVHVSYREGNNRKQILRIKNGVTKQIKMEEL